MKPKSQFIELNSPAGKCLIKKSEIVAVSEANLGTVYTQVWLKTHDTAFNITDTIETVKRKLT